MEKVPIRRSLGKTDSRTARSLARIAAIVVVAALGALIVSGEFGRSVELRAYDSALRVLPDPPVDDGIVILGIDDPAVARVGSWPWSRSILGDGVIDIASLGARHVVLDIEYPDPSPVIVELNEFRSELDRAFGGLRSDLSALAAALESERLGSDGASRVISRLADSLGADVGPRASIEGTLVDRDAYLGNAIAATGSTIVAANWSDERGIDSDGSTLPPRSPTLSVDGSGARRRADVVAGPIPAIAAGAAGVGFVNTRVDPDGVDRRSDLLVETPEGWLPALGFAPLVLDGYVTVEAAEDEFVLRGGGEPIVVPRSSDGSLLLRWHRGQLQDGFATVSYERLIELDTLLRDLVYNFELMADAGYLSALANGPELFDAYDQAREIRRRMVATGNPLLIDQYTPRLETFLSDAASIVAPDSEQRLLAIVDEQASRSDVERLRNQIVDVFDATRGLLNEYRALRERLALLFEDATVFVGFTATSTTDLGVTPFEEEFLNVGTHATLLRTLTADLQLDELPQTVGLLVFLVSIVVLVLAIELLSPRWATALGLILVVLQIGGSFLVFRMTGIYLPLAASSILTFVAFALVTSLSYLMSEHDKRQVRLAFEHYLAPSVIKELLADPDRLDVGGEQRRLTAMFTDVQQFSTVVDRLEPGAVVRLLGDYLGEMTGPILDVNGTIDKYEGDAIVAFFGAPLDDPQHARHACLAAVAMRRLEPVLNDRLVRSGLTPLPLRTRIGIHTGTMTVGNLGTPKRLDYTIIGPEVNLASRLENVNKQYGTWTIVSEETFEAAGEGLLARRMDRVRVIGIDRPVRLYELVGLADDSTSVLREAFNLFAEGLSEFEARNWSKACSLFETVLRIYPTDGPARVFVERCERFEREGVRDSWDGVIALTEK